MREGDRQALADAPILRHLGPALADFSDTAALCALMDVVLSVDTSLAHLAGAMGKDVRILIPFIGQDWRWLLERTDSPWYPSATLYRQGPDCAWAPVLARAGRDLAGLT